MKYSERVLKKTFESSYSSKDAYLKLCKWLANNVINKQGEIGEFLFDVKKVENGNSDKYAFELSLYASLDEKDVNEQHCKVCKEVHRLFYVNEESNCNKCSVMAYRKRMEEKVRIKKSYMKEIISRKVEE